MYDIIVIGSDPAALAAAALAVDRGAETLLVNEGEPRYSFTSLQGYTFDRPPLPWTGLDSFGVFAKFLKDTGIDIPHLYAQQSALQLVLQNLSLTLHGDFERRSRSLARDFFIDHDTVRNHFTRIQSDARSIRKIVPLCLNDHQGYKAHILSELSERKELLRRQKSRLPGKSDREIPRELIEALEAEYAFFSPYRRYDYFDERASYCIDSLIRGSCRLSMGDKAFVIEALQGKIEGGAGTITICDRIDSIELGDRVGIEIITGDQRELQEGAQLIVSTKWQGLPFLVREDERLARWSKEHFDPPGTAMLPFTVHLGADESAMPEHMGENLIIACDKSPGNWFSPYIYVQTSPSGSTTFAPPGKRALAMTVLLYHSPVKLKDDVLAIIASAMLDSLRWYFPFLGEGIADMDLSASIAEARSVARESGHGFTAKDRPFKGLPFLRGLTPVPSLFVAGGELAPLLGLDGDIVSGINAARTACGEPDYVYYP